MLHSLSSRIVALGALVVASLLTLTALLVDGSYRARDSFGWVTHSAIVIDTTDNALSELRTAESGLRGYVLTRDPSFANSFENSASNARHDIGRVTVLTQDNPLQNPRALALASLMDQRTAALRDSMSLARIGAYDQATRSIASGRGREMMDAVTGSASVFLQEERRLQSARVATADRGLDGMRQLALIGALAVVLLVVLAKALMIRSIHGPVRLIQRAMTALGLGEHTLRITTAMGSLGSREFEQLAAGYNAMADRLEIAVTRQQASEQQLLVVNEELQQNSSALRSRGAVIELLGGMAHRLQAARTDDELEEVIRIFVPRVLPNLAGAIYAHNNSRNLLLPMAAFGGFEPNPEGFTPNQCWALRRGQSHSVEDLGSDIVCDHVGEGHLYHCEPLLAGGEVIGTICIMGRLDAESGFRLTAIAKNVASALVNHRLQRDLREQTIRDPLTGLFNRRYMEEALDIEIARAARNDTPLSLVMCDVDHFKRFNDEYGHDAGDVVLQAVAAEMRSRFRGGDLVCRFGGEEFTIIAPGTTADRLVNRVELVRQAINDIDLVHAGRTLGRVSMSFGIATWEPGMGRDRSILVQSADGALYQAKREGRNRAVVDLRHAA